MTDSELVVGSVCVTYLLWVVTTRAFRLWYYYRKS